MALIRSVAISYVFLHVTRAQDATTSLSSGSEQLFWTQGIPDPEGLSKSITAATLSSTSEPLFWTQALSDPDPDSELTATVTLASRTPVSLVRTSSPTSPPNHSTCNTTAPTCPSCDSKTYASPANTNYTIACAAKLYSSSPYAVQRWLGPLACVAECEKNTWCKGATSWAEGNCQLARGEDVFPQYLDNGQEGGYVAFLRVPAGYVPEPPATAPSAFPTGPIPPPSPISHLPQPSDTNAPEPGRCDLRDTWCPSSRGKTITSTSNTTYSIRCNFEPRCDEFINVRGRRSKCSCVAHCDGEEGCAAALFDRGTCGLCLGGLGGLRRYTSPRGYVLFVKEREEGKGSGSGSESGDAAPPTLSPTRLSWATESRHASGSPSGSDSSTARFSPTTLRAQPSFNPESQHKSPVARV